MHIRHHYGWRERLRTTLYWVWVVAVVILAMVAAACSPRKSLDRYYPTLRTNGMPTYRIQVKKGMRIRHEGLYEAASMVEADEIHGRRLRLEYATDRVGIKEVDPDEYHAAKAEAKRLRAYCGKAKR